MAYPTWKSLTEYGLSDKEAADLMVQLVATIGARTTSDP